MKVFLLFLATNSTRSCDSKGSQQGSQVAAKLVVFGLTMTRSAIDNLN
jgi:hypothetical protein